MYSASIGVVDDRDYFAWKQNFGATGPGGGSQLASFFGTIPEPTSTAVLLLVISGMAFTLSRKRWRVHRVLPRLRMHR